MARKEKEAAEDAADTELDSDHAELRVYELGFHIDPELPNEEMRKTFETIQAAIQKSGTVVAIGEPRKIPLAYTVSRMETEGRRDFDASFFAWIAYEATGEGHTAVVEAAQGAKHVFRFLVIRTTKEEARHFSEMQELLARTPEPVHEEEEVLDTELDKALKEVEA